MFVSLKLIIGKYKKSFALFCIGSFIASLGQLVMNIIMAFAIGMMENPTLEEIKSRFWVIGIDAAVMGLSHFFVIRFGLAFKRDIRLELRKMSFSKIINKTYASFNKKSSASYISNLVNDINLFEKDYFAALGGMITFFSMVILSYGVILYVDWVFALGVLIIAVFFSFINYLFQKPTIDLKKNVSDNNEKFSVELSNILNGVEILKLNAVEDTFCEKTIKAIKKLETKKQRYNFLTQFQESFFNLLNLFTNIGVLVYCVNRLFKGLDLTSAAILFQFSNVVIFASAQSIFPRINKYKASKEIYKKIVDIDEEEKNKNINSDQGTLEFKFNDKIEVKNLSYSYDGKKIFDNISFEIKKNKKYLIRGVSGAGKTTLINILSKTVEDYEGSIYLDGVDLKEISLYSFNERIAFIFQNVFLFEDTIKNNIELYKNYSFEKLNSTIRLSGLESFVLEKEDKEDHILAENGKDLSGGQRQRISIARAIIKDSQILFADEAVSSLEEALGRQIEGELLGLDLTLIAISHRYYAGLTEKYDYIIDLKNNGVEIIPASLYFIQIGVIK